MFLWVARIIYHNYKRIHPRPCFIRHRWRDVLVTDHTWRLPVIREVDRNVVSGSDRPIPKKKGEKNQSVTKSRASGEKDKRWPGWRKGPLTDAATHRHAVLFRVKVVPVAATSAVKEWGALPFSDIKVPAGDHCTAWPGLGLFRAHL